MWKLAAWKQLEWLLPRSYLARKLYAILRSYRTHTEIIGRNNHIHAPQAELRGCRIEITGNDNVITIGSRAVLHQVRINLLGDHQRIAIGNGVTMAHDTRINLRSNYATLEIGNDSTFGTVNLNIVEAEAIIRIGEDCMLSNDIDIRTSDSHAIYDRQTGERINLPANVEIEDHVWVGRSCLILKGVTIGTGSVVGAGSVVTKAVPAHSIVVGNPARVVRSDIVWTRDIRAVHPVDAPVDAYGLPLSNVEITPGGSEHE